MVNFFRRLTACLAAAAILSSTALTAFADPGTPDYNEDPGVTVSNTDSIPDPSGDNGEQPAETVTLTAPKLTARTSLNTIQLSWKRVSGAKKYYIYKKQSDGSYKKLGYTTKLKFTDKNLPEGKTQCYKVSAVNGNSKKSATVKVAPSPMRIFMLPNNTCGYKNANGSNYNNLRPGYYTGYVDSINYNGFCVVYTRGETRLVRTSDVKGVSGNYKALSCGAISQLDGKLYKGYACGPGAATILFDAVTGKNISVETTIKIAKDYNVPVYGDYTFLQNGISCKGIKELLRAMLKKYHFTDKKVKVFSTSSYSSASSLAKAFKDHIDQGHRLLVCVTDHSQHTSEGTQIEFTDNPNDPSHYAVITAYTVSGGKTYFFTGDSWYSDRSAYNYAAANNRRNRTTARYYYGLCCTEGTRLARSVFSAASITKDFASVIYIEG